MNSTLEDIRLKEGRTYAYMVGTLERRMDASVNWTMMVDLQTLGLDEIALRKGQEHYVTLVTGRFRDGGIMILSVLPGHEKAVLVEFLRSIPKGSFYRCRLSVVTYGKPIIEAVREEIPTALIVANRFRVARHYHKAADQLRKQELHRLKKELAKEEYQRLKGSMYAFHKNAKGLNKEERKILRNFFEYSPTAKQAYDLRERLTAIFDMSLSK